VAHSLFLSVGLCKVELLLLLLLLLLLPAIHITTNARQSATALATLDAAATSIAQQ
jgi:hypothetical protein